MSFRSFLEAHRSVGQVTTRPYRNRITVAASAFEGEGRVAVHGESVSGSQRVGGLLTVEEAEALVDLLNVAIGYAHATAGRQKANMSEADAR